jgi:DNA-binding NtrC family response regulator
MAHALIVDDNANLRRSLAELVAGCGFSVSEAGDLRDARMQLDWHRPEVVLIDLRLPDGSGLELLGSLEQGGGTAAVVVTGHASVETAVDALRQGAADYLIKPVNIERLRTLLAGVARDAKQASDAAGRGIPAGGRMLGRSAPMKLLHRQIARVAPTEATVLLVGESGTGKELAAQTLHDLSRRSARPFLAVNCGAISPLLIESELFGHERGSFTGADRQHRGYFERADGGTLFLDEITEMPVDLQVKLLRVLESGRFLRIGTDREIAADVRIVAATNRDPEAAVSEGRLRADLYHRLNVFPLQLPPLRERDGDIGLLAEHFLAELNRKHHSAKRFAANCQEHLAAQPWPGNVRELRNCILRAFILSDDEIAAESLYSCIQPPAAPEPATIELSVGTSLAEADRQLILATLERCAGVRKSTAEILGISLKTLYNRLEEYGLQPGRGLQGANDMAQA